MTMNKEENNENLLEDQLEATTETEEMVEEASEQVVEEQMETELVETVEMDENEMIPLYDVETEVIDEPVKKDYSKLKKIVLIGLAAVVLAGAGTFGYMKYDAYSKSYGLTFEGVKYSIEDVKLYMLFQGGDEKAAENAVSALTDSLIINKAAKDQGIELNEQEKFAISDNAKNLRDSVAGQGMTMPEISDERLYDIIAAQTYFGKLMQNKTAEFKVDPAEYKKDYDSYLANNKQDYMEVKMKYILTNSAEDAEKARAAVVGGLAVDKAVKQFSIDYNPVDGARVVDLKTLGLPPEISDEIFNLEADGVSKVHDLSGVFGIFVVQSKSTPPQDQIESSFKNQYTQNKVFELMKSDIDKWREEADIQVNQKAIDALITAKPAEAKK